MIQKQLEKIKFSQFNFVLVQVGGISLICRSGNIYEIEEEL